MKNNHTPGPWKVSDREMKVNEHGALGIDIDFSKTTLNNATVWCIDDSPNEEELANANLIAAAPELLKVAEWALQLCTAISKRKSYSKLFPEATTLSINIEEVIAKATGETINQLP